MNPAIPIIAAASPPDTMVGPTVKRRWLYTVTDLNDETTHVDANGDEICRDDAPEHIATDWDATLEADRRADLWETKQNAIVARATRHSQGIAK